MFRQCRLSASGRVDRASYRSGVQKRGVGPQNASNHKASERKTMTRRNKAQAVHLCIGLLWCFVGSVVFVLWAKYQLVEPIGSESIDFIIGWCVQFPVLLFCCVCWMRSMCILSEDINRWA